MKKWKQHTPDGVQDILELECYAKKDLQGKIASTFKHFGFYEIEPGSLEFYDVFSGASESITQEDMFKFFDNQGRILVLRPDITMPIARIMGTKLKNATLPNRLYYIGNAFRYNDFYSGGKLREFTQAGIELIGINTPEADAEVIAIAIKSLIASGLTNFQIEIGQVEFFKGLMEESKLKREIVEEIRLLIDSKNSLAIEQLLQEYDLSEELKKVIINIPTLFGEIEIIDRMEKLTKNKRSLNALKNLRLVYDILVDYGLEKYISIDLGMVQSINYYTGIIFKGFTHGLGFPVCSGGRYDRLISEFGKDLPAMGVAIGINRLLLALKGQDIDFQLWKIDSLIAYHEKGRKTAFQIADQLRKQGLVIEMFLEPYNFDKIISYANDKNINGVISVYDDEKIQLYNILTEEKVETTIMDLLGED